MEAVTTLQEVRSLQTRSGNTRYVARGADGNEYTTFRAEIGNRARELQGLPVRITFHEEHRGQYTNVYLDSVEPVEDDAASTGDTDVQEAAWRTAVEAAPWLVGKPEAGVSPEELYDKLKPFEERVESDIQESKRSRTDRP
ncbi:MAG: hypothetical protein JOY58_07615 [Solirubrobacterales bacterium]|nr:hypothetical protein [Solirubrobacterales bacterium]